MSATQHFVPSTQLPVELKILFKILSIYKDFSLFFRISQDPPPSHRTQNAVMPYCPLPAAPGTGQCTVQVQNAWAPTALPAYCPGHCPNARCPRTFSTGPGGGGSCDILLFFITENFRSFLGVFYYWNFWVIFRRVLLCSDLRRFFAKSVYVSIWGEGGGGK